jgi:hypothetical protein
VQNNTDFKRIDNNDIALISIWILNLATYILLLHSNYKLQVFECETVKNLLTSKHHQLCSFSLLGFSVQGAY